MNAQIESGGILKLYIPTCWYVRLFGQSTAAKNRLRGSGVSMKLLESQSKRFQQQLALIRAPIGTSQVLSAGCAWILPAREGGSLAMFVTSSVYVCYFLQVRRALHP